MKSILERYRYSVILLKQLVITDFKIRYQGSVLGYLWTLLRPLALFLVLWFVFTNFLRVGSTIEHYPVYLLLGIMLWNFFTEVTQGGVSAIVGKSDLLRKLNFPKYIIVLAGSTSAIINLALNSIILIIFMIFSGVNISWTVIFLPLVLIELFILAIGFSFLLSALYVKFRDVNYVWEVVLQAGFYATPILYPLSLVPQLTGQIMMLNPIAQIIQDVRYMLITPQSATVSSVFSSQLFVLIPIMITLAIAIPSAVYFRNRSKFFAEEV